MREHDNGAINLFDLNQPSMREFFARMSEKPYRATQLMKWLYHKGVSDINCMTDLSRDLRQRLTGNVDFTLPEILTEQISADGTVKWLLRVDEKNCI